MPRATFQRALCFLCRSAPCRSHAFSASCSRLVACDVAAHGVAPRCDVQRCSRRAPNLQTVFVMHRWQRFVAWPSAVAQRHSRPLPAASRGVAAPDVATRAPFRDRARRYATARVTRVSLRSCGWRRRDPRCCPAPRDARAACAHIWKPLSRFLAGSASLPGSQALPSILPPCPRRRGVLLMVEGKRRARVKVIGSYHRQPIPICIHNYHHPSSSP